VPVPVLVPLLVPVPARAGNDGRAGYQSCEVVGSRGTSVCTTSK